MAFFYLKTNSMKYLAIIICFLSIITSLYADDVSVDVTHPQMQNECADGFIDLIITGGYAPYSVKYEKFFEHEVFGLIWLTVKEIDGVNGTDGSEDLEDAVAGEYRITITDFHCGKVTTGAELVCECNPCEITADIVEPTCNSEDGGSIAIQMLCDGKSQGPYTAKWGDGGSGLYRTGLEARRYCVNIYDKNECRAHQCWILGNEGVVNINLSEKVNPTFCGDGNLGCNGILAVSIEGGTPPYSYSWSNNTNGSSIDDLCVGEYTITVTDRSGCSSIQSYSLCCCEPFESGYDPEGNLCSDNVEPILLQSEITSLPNGSITTTVSGGLSEKSCNWSGPDGFIDHGCNGISGITQQGTYCLAITDGCTNLRKCFKVIDCNTSDLMVSGATINTCEGLDAGSINLTITGGNPPYSKSWSNGSSSEDLERLLAGTFCVTVKDDSGCTVEACFEVDESSAGETVPTHTPCQSKTVCNGLDFNISTASYSYIPTNGTCTFDQYCSESMTTVTIPLWPCEVISTFGCTREHICANGLADTEFGTIDSNDGPYGVEVDEMNNCPGNWGCTSAICTLTSEAGIPETVNASGGPPSCAKSIYFEPNSTKATEKCGVGNVYIEYRCGYISDMQPGKLVDSECVPITQPPNFSSDSLLNYKNVMDFEPKTISVKVTDIYPNPLSSSNDLIISLVSSAKTQNVSFEIYDLLGTLLKSINAESIIRGGNEFRLEMSSLKQGLFIIDIKHNNISIFTQRIVKH